MKRKANKEFIDQVKRLVGTEYTFLEPYNGARTKIKVVHNTCGRTFCITPDNFLRGKRCPFESVKHKKIMANKINQQLRPYKLTLALPYQNSKTMLKIKCKKCGLIFNRLYETLKENKKCPYCNNQKVSWDTFTFGEYVQAKTKSEYKLISDFKGVSTNVKIYHKKCGHTYEVMPLNFLKGDRCPYETGERRGNANRITQQEFEKRLKDVWGREYKNVGKYVASKRPITVIHTKCGKAFETTPDSLLHHHGCPFCKESLGERKIAKYLTSHNISYVAQKKFASCKNKLELPFDFYIPSLNMCLEYDGEQHFKPLKFFGGKKKFEYRHHNDLIKNKFCKEAGIKLIRIKYNEKLDERLEQIF